MWSSSGLTLHWQHFLPFIVVVLELLATALALQVGMDVNE